MMNRPVRKEYHGRSGKNYFTEKYIKELEEYSENLEQRCLSDEWDLTCLDKDCKNLEKALDKACALLTYDQFNAIPPKELLNFCMKDWKEWLMEDCVSEYEDEFGVVIKR